MLTLNGPRVRPGPHDHRPGGGGSIDGRIVAAALMALFLAAMPPSRSGLRAEASARGHDAVPEDGAILLFDGKTLNGWQAVPADSASDWSVRDGVIVGRGSVDRLAYLVWKDRQLTDFELTLQYRFPGNGNSGVEIRAQPDPSKRRPLIGYHADLGQRGFGILGCWDLHFAGRDEPGCPRGTRLVIAADGKTRSSKIENALTFDDIHAHQWNRVRIVAQGQRFRFYINGKRSAELVDQASEGRLERGAIGLQIHDKGMQIEFKDIRLKRLGAAKTKQP